MSCTQQTIIELIKNLKRTCPSVTQHDKIMEVFSNMGLIKKYDWRDLIQKGEIDWFVDAVKEQIDDIKEDYEFNFGVHINIKEERDTITETIDDVFETVINALIYRLGMERFQMEEHDPTEFLESIGRLKGLELN